MKRVKSRLIIMAALFISLSVVFALTFFTAKYIIIGRTVQSARQYIAYHAGRIDEWIEFEGVSFDYFPNEIAEYVRSLGDYPESYLFLINRDGFVVSHPNMWYAGNYNNAFSLSMDLTPQNRFAELNRGYFLIKDYDDVTRFFIPYSNERSEWTICFAISEDVPAKLYNRLFFLVSPFAALITATAVILTLRTIKKGRQRKLRETLRKTQKLYLKAVSNTNTFFFDYDVKNKQAVHSIRVFEKYGIPEVMYDVPESLIKMNIMNSDDADGFCKMFDDIDNGLSTSECVIRLNDFLGNEDFYSIVMTNSFDKQGEPERAVAAMRDITEEKNAERELQYKAERDAMTGFYNKSAGITLIEDELTAYGKKSLHALFVIDVDNFKSINDTFGHDIGDLAILDVSQALTDIFKETDVLCRFGGDEFIVFAKCIPNTGFVREKADKICDAFQKSYGDGDTKVNISSSIGIACFPIHGCTYEELFKNADLALYETKDKGKNSYTIYDANN